MFSITFKSNSVLRIHIFYLDLLSSINIKKNKINLKQIFWAYFTYIIIEPYFKNINKNGWVVLRQYCWAYCKIDVVYNQEHALSYKKILGKYNKNTIQSSESGLGCIENNMISSLGT